MLLTLNTGLLTGLCSVGSLIAVKLSLWRISVVIDVDFCSCWWLQARSYTPPCFSTLAEVCSVLPISTLWLTNTIPHSTRKHDASSTQCAPKSSWCARNDRHIPCTYRYLQWWDFSRGAAESSPFTRTTELIFLDRETQIWMAQCYLVNTPRRLRAVYNVPCTGIA